MSSNDQTIRDSEVGLDEPHFDEEATLLAARPVVPLVEVKAKKRSKARWALSLAIVGGLLVGLLGATFLYRYLGSEPRVAEATEVREQPAEPQTSAGGTVPVAAETSSEEEKAAIRPALETQPEAEQETRPAPARTDSGPARAEPPTRSAPKPRPVIVRDSTDRSEAEEMQEREMRRARRQQERREERRAARRDNRERAQTNDDLLRIREIFEGAPRP